MQLASQPGFDKSYGRLLREMACLLVNWQHITTEFQNHSKILFRLLWKLDALLGICRFSLRSLEPIMAAPLYTTASGIDFHSISSTKSLIRHISGLYFHAGKILVLTVGLPARGKTHISRALERYLRWMGIKTLVVSLGDYRRRVLGSAQTLPSDYFTLGDHYFINSMQINWVTLEERRLVKLRSCERR